MPRTIGICLAALLWAVLGSTTAFAHDHNNSGAPKPGWHDGYPFGFGIGWTSKYYAVGGCPGNQQRPWNPLLGVPIHSSLGQTGPRRMLLWPPQVGSPLYNNTPRLVPYPPDARPCHGVICPN